MTAMFVSFHVLVGLAFLTGVTWEWLGLALSSYAVRMFAVTAGSHRYFSHRAFKTNRLVQFLLAWVAQLSFQRGVLWWAARHRQHHKHADTAEDLHSPVRMGFWWSHVGWFLSRRYESTDSDAIKDFSRFPELVWLNDYWFVPGVSALALTWFLGGLPAVVWAGIIPTVLVWHASFAINSLGHLFGKRRYLTPDTSRNSAWLALLTLGEGWHNNHHRSQGSTRLGWFWWELDPTFFVLKFLSWVGVVRDLRPVRPEVKYCFREYTVEQRALLVEQSAFGKFEPLTRVATPESQAAVSPPAEPQREHVGFRSVG